MQRPNDVAAVWLKVPTDFCHYISIASHYGFQFHHTQPKFVMMYLWLPEDVPDKVPTFGTHHLGVAGARCGSEPQPHDWLNYLIGRS